MLLLHLSFADEQVSYTLPYHKTDPFYNGSTILLLHQQTADPVTLLRRYINLRDSLHGAHPALFICRDGTLPNRNWFDKQFFAILSHKYGGHSARAGGATFYAKLGLPEDIIMALGRWSSQAWREYVREHPALRAEVQLARLRNS